MLQIFGLILKIIGIGIMLDGNRATIDTAPMVISLVLIGMGGAMSGCRVPSGVPGFRAAPGRRPRHLPPEPVE